MHWKGSRSIRRRLKARGSIGSAAEPCSPWSSWLLRLGTINLGLLLQTQSSTKDSGLYRRKLYGFIPLPLQTEGAWWLICGPANCRGESGMLQQVIIVSRGASEFDLEHGCCSNDSWYEDPGSFDPSHNMRLYFNRGEPLRYGSRCL